MAVTLQFCAFTTGWGMVIPWFTQGLVGHVDAVLPDGSLLGAQHEDGLGGMPAGVQIRPADYGEACGMTRRMRVRLPCADGRQDAFLGFLHAQLGKPYDMRAIEAFIAGRDWRSPDAWFCSELQAAALEAAGILPRLCTPANKVTPASLMLVCSAFAPVTPLD